MKNKNNKNQKFNTPLLTQLKELESHLEVIDARMKQCIVGQRKIKDLI